MAKLTGTPGTQISTPHGLIAINHKGVATISDDQATFIKERIDAGSLPDYALEAEKATGKPGKKPPTDAKLVAMTRAEPEQEGGPVAADVPPKEVDGRLAAGWVVVDPVKP